MAEVTNEPIENEVQEEKTIEQDRVKTFTQDEVDNLISESLASEKAKYEATFAEKEQNIKKMELRLKAKEMLIDSNIPIELLDVIKFSDEASLDKNISIVKKYFNDNSKNGFIKVGAVSDVNRASIPEDNMFAKAMGIIKGE